MNQIRKEFCSWSKAVKSAYENTQFICYSRNNNYFTLIKKNNASSHKKLSLSRVINVSKKLFEENKDILYALEEQVFSRNMSSRDYTKNAVKTMKHCLEIHKSSVQLTFFLKKLVKRERKKESIYWHQFTRRENSCSKRIQSLINYIFQAISNRWNKSNFATVERELTLNDSPFIKAKNLNAIFATTFGLIWDRADINLDSHLSTNKDTQQYIECITKENYTQKDWKKMNRLVNRAIAKKLHPDKQNENYNGRDFDEVRKLTELIHELEHLYNREMSK